jgi:hypothetical protein
MTLKGKVILFIQNETMVDIIDVATGQVVQQHVVEGTLGSSASLQKSIAAMALSAPQDCVHVMDIKSGKVMFKFILPDGENATVALSKDTFTLAVGTDTGI